MKIFKKVIAFSILLIFIISISSCGTSNIFEKTSGKNFGSIEIFDHENNEILSYEFSFDDGCTVYDALMYSAKQKKIAVDKKGVGSSVYISSINGLSEFDKGATSGWLYTVNGDSPAKSCNDYNITHKDEIKWIYSIDSIADNSKEVEKLQ